jgi:UPF0042 nucleotide-binding protein
MMRFIVITGMSGAGKALAMRAFEDFGFFCVDNLPPALVPMLAELCQRGSVGRIAVVTDVRGGQFFDELLESLDKLRADGVDFQILYMDADDDALIARFRETRRRHPLSDDFPDLHEAIAREREALADLRARADKNINTSRVTPRELREEIRATFLDVPESPQMLIRVQSFGFKHGLPTDADLVFDLRFLPNPNYDRDIGHLDGTCAPVIEYVFRDPVTQKYLEHLHSFLEFCVPQYEKEGKSYLSIAVGCTGGRHRSVALANWLADDLAMLGHRASATHRDLDRSAREARNFEGPPNIAPPAQQPQHNGDSKTAASNALPDQAAALSSPAAERAQ